MRRVQSILRQKASESATALWIPETTPLGAAYAAGLAIGFYDDLEKLQSNWLVDKTWHPEMDAETRARKYRYWQKAVKKSFNWVE